MALSLRASSSVIFSIRANRALKRRNGNDVDAASGLSSSPNLLSPFFPKLFKSALCRLKPVCAVASPVGDHHYTGDQQRLHGITQGHEVAPACGRGVPVYVMLPLDTVVVNGGDGRSVVNRCRAMQASMAALRSAGVEGVMVDVWWGVVERDGPGKYDWDAYEELVKMAERAGLKIQAVMSFHQCGGNVGDSCSIPLPPWVLEEVSSYPDIVYTDGSGRRNPEYISLGCDNVPVLRGRTPIQVYSDYMQSFRNRFSDYLGSIIVEVQIGMGPCGELRYPSYPESNGTWKFPGIGEFQCYDKYMKASLQAAAIAAGHPEWGNGGPHDAGHYNQFPEDTNFFRREGSWNSEYGQFFLRWYSEMLLDHGDRVLATAESVFRCTGAKLSAKVAGIHWHYKTRSHAAELTAGYYNTRYRDGYAPIAQMLAKNGVVLNFTCMEMKDEQQPMHANCSPELLVQQVKSAAKIAGVALAGENALERYDELAYGQVTATSQSESGLALTAFTYLRMNKRLFDGENWQRFVNFVRAMSEGGDHRSALPRCDTDHSDVYVGFINKGKRKPESHNAAAALKA